MISNKIGVAIGTFGDRSFWGPFAQRAMKSVEVQTQQCAYQWVHGASLHEARNEAAEILITEGVQWLIFLDADDELAPDYIFSMACSASSLSLHTHDVFQPSVQAVINGEEQKLFFNTPTPLLQQNYLTIGCMHSAYLFDKIHGFDDWPMLEDWAYWLKAWVNGARFKEARSAVYRAHIDADRPGRNRGSKEAEVATKIRAMYRLIAQEQGLA